MQCIRLDVFLFLFPTPPNAVVGCYPVPLIQGIQSDCNKNRVFFQKLVYEIFFFGIQGKRWLAVYIELVEPVRRDLVLRKRIGSGGFRQPVFDRFIILLFYPRRKSV
jgi:hypothetical protein